MLEKELYWAEIYAKAKHGHTLWDGKSSNGTDSSLAYKTAKEFVDYVSLFGFFKPKNFVLDVGCGNGRFATVFSEKDVTYFGIDPCFESIEFCKDVFSKNPNCKFEFANIYNPSYNPSGDISPEEWKMPYPNNFFDDIVVNSIFTHLQTLKIANNYIKEIKRVLKPGGKLFCTWFRSPPNEISEDAGQTCYPEHEIINMLFGLTIDYSYGGHTTDPFDQWALFCTKPNVKIF